MLAEIEKNAAARRQPGETKEIAYSKYITETDEGKLLFAESQRAQYSSVGGVGHDVFAKAVERNTSASAVDRLAKLTTALKESAPFLSDAECREQVFSKNADLVAAANAVVSAAERTKTYQRDLSSRPAGMSKSVTTKAGNEARERLTRLANNLVQTGASRDFVDAFYRVKVANPELATMLDEPAGSKESIDATERKPTWATPEYQPRMGSRSNAQLQRPIDALTAYRQRGVDIDQSMAADIVARAYGMKR